jgi:hypothetical protein
MGEMINAYLESLKGREHSEDLNVKGRIILKTDSRAIGLEGVACIFLPQDRDR